MLVKAAASENGRTIDHLEVWDNTTGKKLGNFPGTTVNQTFTFTAGTHQLIVQDVSAGAVVYHKEYATIIVSSSNGVFITQPANNSTQSATLLPVRACAVEGVTPVNHLEIWDNGTKLGNSPTGSTVAQWFPSLSVGAHALSILAIASNGAIINTTTFNYTASSADGVYVNAPANNSSQTGTTVHINAYASEYASPVLIDHMEVWDNTHGVKLANSPTGTGLTSLYIDQNVTLGYGVGIYQLAILDVNASGFTRVNTTYVTITIH